MAVIQTDVSAEQCLKAIRHVASLYEVGVSGGPASYSVRIPPALANPGLVVKLGDELPQLDATVELRISISSSPRAAVQIEAGVPLYYMTGALGFAEDCVQSFATTLQATVRAYAGKGKMPTFPAPPRAPQA